MRRYVSLLFALSILLAACTPSTIPATPYPSATAPPPTRPLPPSPPRSIDPPSPMIASAAPATPATSTPIPSATQGTIYALLADNRLLAVRAADGTTLAEHRLAPTPSMAHWAGHRLALGTGGTRLFVLTSSGPGGTDLVAVLDVTTNALLTSYPLAESGNVFRSLAIGPQTGRLFLFGVSPHDSKLRVAILDPASGRLLADWSGDLGNDELIQGAVSADEQRLLVAYHQAGIKQYELTAEGLRQCQLASPRRCLKAHGDFALYGDRVLTGGDDEGPIIEYGSDDQVRRRLPMGLEGNHMVALAVDPARERLYVLGSCAYTPGLSAVSLRESATPAPPEVIFPSMPRGDRSAVPCGARLASGPGPLLVVGRLSLELPEPRALGTILIIDIDARQIVRTVPTPSEPSDLLIVTRPEPTVASCSIG